MVCHVNVHQTARLDYAILSLVRSLAMSVRVNLRPVLIYNHHREPNKNPARFGGVFDVRFDVG